MAGSPRRGAGGTTGAGRRRGSGRRAGRSAGRAGPRCVPGRLPRGCRTRSRPAGSGTGGPGPGSGLRASGWTLVASMTVSRPPARRLAATRWSSSKASGVTDWSFSSSRDDGPEEVGREDLGRLEVPAGERGLARPGRPDQNDEGQLGDGDRHGLRRPESKHAHLRRRPDRRVLRPDPARRRPCNRGGRPRPRPRCGTRPASTRSGGRGGGTCRPAGPETSRCTRCWGSSARRPPGRANSNTTRSNAVSRGGSRCSITSTTAAASNPASRASRYATTRATASPGRARRGAGRAAVPPRCSGHASRHPARPPPRTANRPQTAEQLSLAAAQVDHPAGAAGLRAPSWTARRRCSFRLRRASSVSSGAAASASSGTAPSLAVSWLRADRTSRPWRLR